MIDIYEYFGKSPSLAELNYQAAMHEVKQTSNI